MKFIFHHAHILASDLNVTATFLVEALGAEIVKYRKFRTANGAILNLNGSLIYIREPEPGECVSNSDPMSVFGWEHVCLEVDDIETAALKLEKFGGRFLIPPRPSSTGKGKIGYFTGPDNLLFELIQTE
jgi:catechol 2,3-dioxygenase-like lactoylglutathione lyase family enzyme